jgi:hypothetical protein
MARRAGHDRATGAVRVRPRWGGDGGNPNVENRNPKPPVPRCESMNTPADSETTADGRRRRSRRSADMLVRLGRLGSSPSGQACPRSAGFGISSRAAVAPPSPLSGERAVVRGGAARLLCWFPEVCHRHRRPCETRLAHRRPTPHPHSFSPLRGEGEGGPSPTSAVGPASGTNAEPRCPIAVGGVDWSALLLSGTSQAARGDQSPGSKAVTSHRTPDFAGLAFRLRISLVIYHSSFGFRS